MQTIKHGAGYSYIHPLFLSIDRFYADMSEDTSMKSLIPYTYDTTFAPLLEIFQTYGEFTKSVAFRDVLYTPIEVTDQKTMIVCFSGGKDSFACARHYQKLGYKVILYHVHGINRAYLGERAVAQQCADAMGLPIYFESVHYEGDHCWVEHPMKNMIIANMAITFGIRNGFGTKLAFGNFRTSHLEDNEFSVCGGDCVEMWDAYVTIVRRILPKFKVYYPNVNAQTAFYALQREPQYLPYVMSCLAPNRFREQFRRRTLKSHHVELLPNRCGCCWKCALEYIWFTDNNILEFDMQYYLHCIRILHYTLRKETGVIYNTVRSVWDEYLFYPMTKSKAYKELQYATISTTGKIKSPYYDSTG